LPLYSLLSPPLLAPFEIYCLSRRRCHYTPPVICMMPATLFASFRRRHFSLAGTHIVAILQTLVDTAPAPMLLFCALRCKTPMPLCALC